MGVKGSWPVKVRRRHLDGEERLVTVGRLAMRSETFGTLYVDALNAEYPVFQAREQTVPGVVQYVVKVAKPIPRPQPGGRTVGYRDVGEVELQRDGTKGLLDIYFLPGTYEVQPPGVATGLGVEGSCAA